jgi:hypothetical protein
MNPQRPVAGKDCKRNARKEHLHNGIRDNLIRGTIRFDRDTLLIGVIPSAAAFQAERGISRASYTRSGDRTASTLISEPNRGRTTVAENSFAN